MYKTCGARKGEVGAKAGPPPPPLRSCSIFLYIYIKSNEQLRRGGEEKVGSPPIAQRFL